LLKREKEKNCSKRKIGGGRKERVSPKHEVRDW
jgi:hypothetical protein